MTVVVGAGGIGQAIARRISSGRHILVANHSQQSADNAAQLLEDAGFPTTAMHADVSDRAMVQAGKVDSCLVQPSGRHFVASPESGDTKGTTSRLPLRWFRPERYGGR